MINNKDISVVNLSATKKDFYQVWNELIDTARKISERWDPAATNESDPGIVLLKVLTACVDKLNYTVDKNILEAFMPSAAQQQSMRKLCDMMGYSMKYYQSAETGVSIAFVPGDLVLKETDLDSKTILLKRFTKITNIDSDQTYFIKDNFKIALNGEPVTVDCMEGFPQKCALDEGGVVTLQNLDDNNRFYLPENKIAENGFFIYNAVADDTYVGLDSMWEKKDNLNIYGLNKKIFKFGYDSIEGRPYIQFPEDIPNLIEDGLVIYYTRTNGINGNVSANTLQKLQVSELKIDDSSEITINDTNFIVNNSTASTNGADIESITDAYNNYKKIIGTFDTLVTCRDYINAIYNLLDNNNYPYVSNIIVSDIRDDINRAQTLCSFNEYGMYYNEETLLKEKDGKPEPSINCFDLMLYPLKTSPIMTNDAQYKDSFTYTKENEHYIKELLDDYKCIAHKFNYPDSNEIVCIKNYLKLNAVITTNYKVNLIESAEIIDNIKAAIRKDFYARNIDFGDEIPYELILKTIESADSRIKNVSLDDPEIITKVMTAENKEYPIEISGNSESDEIAKQLYNKLALRNILAGRIEIFDYDTSFEVKPEEEPAPNKIIPDIIPPEGANPAEQLEKIETDLTVSKATILGENEEIQFRAPNFETIKTYPAYVNYYYKSPNAETQSTAAIPAKMGTLAECLSNILGKNEEDYWLELIDSLSNHVTEEQPEKGIIKIPSSTLHDAWKIAGNNYGSALFNISQNNTWQHIINVPKEKSEETSDYYCIKLNDQNYATVVKKIRDWYNSDVYVRLGSDVGLAKGYLVDDNYCRYIIKNRYTTNYTFSDYFTAPVGTSDQGYTVGENAHPWTVLANTIYKLAEGEKLYLNYVPGNSAVEETSNTSTKVNAINEILEAGTIICPNFNLVPSNINTKKFDKTSGYAFDDAANIAGMYSLGANEKIEVKEQKKIELNSTAKIYWTLHEDNIETDKQTNEINIKFIEHGSEKDKYYTYTLKEDEFVFYTDKYEQALVYYGSGTEIKCTTGDVKAQFSRPASNISAYDIIEYGVKGIPWKTCEFNNTDETIIEEFQYITLSQGDQLLNWEPAGNSDTTKINSKEWIKVTNVEYILKGSEGTKNRLFDLDLKDDASEENITWEAQTNYLLDMSNKDAQYIEGEVGTDKEIVISFANVATTFSETNIRALYSSYLEYLKKEANNNSIQFVDSTGIKIENLDLLDFDVDTKDKSYSIKRQALIKGGIDSDNLTKYSYTYIISVTKNEANNYELNHEIIITEHFYHIWLKSNKIIQSLGLSNTLMLKEMVINKEGVAEPQYNTKFYLFDKNKDDLLIKGSETQNKQVRIETFAENWYRINLSAMSGKNEYFNLNANIPNNKYGLLMIYAMYAVQNDSTTKINLSALNNAESAKSVEALEFFNEGTGKKSTLTLKKGLNIIKISQKCKLKISGANLSNAALLFGNIDIVNETKNNESNSNEGIKNSIIQYYAVDKDKNAEQQLLSDIKTALSKMNKQDFYYNCLIPNSLAMNINNEYYNETLRTPKVWYDSNNINNKFVISEIDIDSISGGIVIAKSSKI